MKSDFIIALTQLAAERNLPREIVLSAIEAALISAYKKDSIAAGQDISVKLDPASGEVSVFVIKTAVEEVTDPQQELTLAEARKLKPDAELGDTVPTDSLPHSAGRIAAQTAKQVVLQRLRDAERELIFQEFADKEGEIFTVTIQRIEPKQITVELGRAEAILPPSEQAPFDRYRVGQKMKVLLQSVRQSNKGPELIVSRSDVELVKRLFEIEVPEIFNGAVEIIAMSREAGARSKVAVWAKQDGVDAVGSCVGLRGIRIQNIVNELHGEKIDVVQWNKDPVRFLASALSPSQVMRVDLDEEKMEAVAIVPERQLSLAIGKEGQNARLAARLTGWRVDIRSDVEDKAAPETPVPAASIGETIGMPTPAEGVYGLALDRLALPARARNVLVKAGIDKVGQVLEKTDADLLEIKSFGQKSLDILYEQLRTVDQLVPEPEAEPVVEEPVAEAVEVVQTAMAEAAAEPAAAATEVVAAPASGEPEPAPVAPIPEDLFAPVRPEPVPVAAESTSIQDLPENIWAVRGGLPAEAGAIRFAEDIAELNRGGPGRGRRGSRRGRQSGRGRKTRAFRKR